MRISYSPKYLLSRPANAFPCLASSLAISCTVSWIASRLAAFAFNESYFASGSTVLGLYTHLKVLLGAVGYDFAQELCEFSSVLSLFVSGFLVVQANFRITLSVSNSCHCQIHTNLRALALEVCTILEDIFGNAFSNANHCSAAQLMVSCSSV